MSGLPTPAEPAPGPARPAIAPDVAALFPLSSATAYDLRGEGDEAWLLAEEEPAVAGAIASRRRQFAAGRRCARLALTGAGFEATAIPVGERRAPRWPAGATGSISHTEGYVVSVAARRSSAADGAGLTIGIDAERLGRVGENLYSWLFVDVEQRDLRRLGPERRDVAATAMFGAKEAFYKAQFAVTGAWVNFSDVVLVATDDGPTGGGFELRPATDLDALDAFEWPLRAQWRLDAGVVVTAVEALPAPSVSAPDLSRGDRPD